MNEMSGYQINEKDIATVIRYLKTHDPDNADREYAIQMLQLMQEIAKEMVGADMELAGLFLKALKTKKNQNEPPRSL